MLVLYNSFWWLVGFFKSFLEILSCRDHRHKYFSFSKHIIIFPISIRNVFKITVLGGLCTDRDFLSLFCFSSNVANNCSVFWKYSSVLSSFAWTSHFFTWINISVALEETSVSSLSFSASSSDYKSHETTFSISVLNSKTYKVPPCWHECLFLYFHSRMACRVLAIAIISCYRI